MPWEWGPQSNSLIIIYEKIILFQGLTFFLGYSIFAAVLGMLQFGYNTGVINAPESVRTLTNKKGTYYLQSTFFYVLGHYRYN